MKTGIYTIKNTVTGRIYIGRSKNVAQRWRLHKSDLNRGKHHNEMIQADWEEYGAEAFVFAIVVTCDPHELGYQERHITSLAQRMGTPLYNYWESGSMPKRTGSAAGWFGAPKRVRSPNSEKSTIGG